MKRNTMLTIAIGAILLIGATAAASVYVMDTKDNTETRVVHHTASAPAPAQPACDDDNIVGKIIGGAAGGAIGSQVGGGSGKTVATTAGAVGGTIAGEKYIATKNVTCR